MFVIIWVRYVSIVTNMLERINIYEFEILKLGVKNIAVIKIEIDKINLVKK